MTDSNPQKHSLNEVIDPVNPWLAEAILAFRKKYPDDKIRELFRAILCLAPNKPWETFISEQALVMAARENPFLRTPVESLELPKATHELLHLFLVEYVIDLIQSLYQTTLQEVSTLCIH